MTKNRQYSPMKMSIFCVVLVLFFGAIAWAADWHEVTATNPKEGVYASSNMFSSTVIELKHGRFRYWFFTDVKIDLPSFPVTGKYTLDSDEVTLNSKDVFEKKWLFKKLDGQLTLWRPSAVENWIKDRTLDPWGVLHYTTITAEKAWGRGPEPATPAVAPPVK